MADGSYTALLFAPRTRRWVKDRLLAAARAGQEVELDRARLVRAVDYTVPQANPESELITLVTTVADPRELSALELAGAYARRWEHESALDEVKTRLLRPVAVLSSQSPAMVTSQVYGLLLAHYAIRWLMFEAADGAGYDPDRMGFTHSVRLVRRAAEGARLFPLSSCAWCGPVWWPGSCSGPTGPGGLGPILGGSTGPATTATGSNAPLMSGPGTHTRPDQH